MEQQLVPSDLITSYRYIEPRTLQFRTVLGDFYESTNFDPTHFPFSVNGFIHYEPETDTYFRNYKISEGVYKPREMTQEEIAQAKEFIKTLVELENIDFELPAYETDLDNLYQGKFPLSVIKEKNWKWTLKDCDYPVGRFNETTNEWEAIKAIITEDGGFQLDPPSYCDKCIKFFTEEEWQKLPPIPTEVSHGEVYLFDLKTSTWYDGRVPSRVKSQMESYITSVFSNLQQLNEQYYLELPTSSSMRTSIELINQVMATTNNKLSSNDRYSQLATDASKEITHYLGIPNSEEFSPSIMDSDDLLWRYNQYREANSVLEGQMQAWLSVLNSGNYKTLEDYDELRDKFTKWYSDWYGADPKEFDPYSF